MKLTIAPDGTLTDEHGANCGRIVNIELDIELDNTHPRNQQEEPSPFGSALSLKDSSLGGVTEKRHQAVDVGSTDAVVAREERLDGTDNRRALIDHWARVFGKKPIYSPTRMRAAERAFKEEPDLNRLVLAMEGFKTYRVTRPGGVELATIFGTYRGTGDLASRIEWLVSLVEPHSSTSVPFQVPSEQRAMLMERTRHLVAWLQHPGDMSNVQRGELAQQWFRDTFGKEGVLKDGEIEWVHPAAPYVGP